MARCGGGRGCGAYAQQGPTLLEDLPVATRRPTLMDFAMRIDAAGFRSGTGALVPERFVGFAPRNLVLPSRNALIAEPVKSRPELSPPLSQPKRHGERVEAACRMSI